MDKPAPIETIMDMSRRVVTMMQKYDSHDVATKAAACRAAAEVFTQEASRQMQVAVLASAMSNLRR